MRLLLSISILLATLSLSHAQTRMPARQVSVVTNDFEHIDPVPMTAQGAFQWIDDNWDPGLDTNQWSSITPSDETTQAAFNWVDGWLSLGPYLYGTNIVGATFTNGQWTIAPNEIPLSTNGWTWLNPTEETVQSTFDFIDGEGPFLPGTNIVGAAFEDDQWTVPVPGIADKDTWFMGYTESNTDTGTAGVWRELGADPDYVQPMTADGAFSGARFTAQEPGVHWFSASAVVRVGGSSPNNGRLVISKNGSAAAPRDPRESMPLAYNEPHDASTAFQRLSGSVFWLVDLEEGDYVSIWGHCTGNWGTKLTVEQVSFMGGKL